MMCVEFDISQIPIDNEQLNSDQESEATIRVVNQALVESTIHFFVNGVCHG